jgi:Tol biopolymer transport system component
MRRDGTHVRLLSKKDSYDRAAWSPTRPRIVFVATANHAQGGGFQLFSIRPDGTHVRLLTRGRGGHPGSYSNFSPDFSPNGKRIVVSRRTFPGGFHVWIMRADGSHRHRLTRTARHNQVGPVFSPNGKKIAYEEYPSINASGFEGTKVMRTDGSHLRKVIPSGFSPSWGVRP